MRAHAKDTQEELVDEALRGLLLLLLLLSPIRGGGVGLPTARFFPTCSGWTRRRRRRRREKNPCVFRAEFQPVTCESHARVYARADGGGRGLLRPVVVAAVAFTAIGGEKKKEQESSNVPDSQSALRFPHAV